MKVGIMQPYIFPYIGYFQLIGICDKFVVHDDVQYIRQGWINRNRIIVHRSEYRFVFSVKNDDYSRKINERVYSSTFNVEARKLLRNIDQSYSKAPFFHDFRALLVEVLESDERSVSILNTLAIRAICRYLGIDTEIIESSKMDFDKSLMGEPRVLEINERLGSTHYINPIGGMQIYSRDSFRARGMKLSFLKACLTPYKQLSAEFIPGLSIIDVLMNCSRENVVEMLEDFDLS